MTGSTRLASANVYDNAVTQLTTRQSQMSKLQEQLSASKRVLRPSDDPTAAAQAERAITRQARVTTDTRALEVQRNAMASAESTLGNAVSAVQEFRTLVVQAGNSSLTSTDRASIAQRLSTLRDQVLGYANSQDSNGMPLFGALGSTSSPFVDQAGGVTFDGVAGQSASGAVAVPSTLDGFAAFMNVPTGNGVFSVSQASANGGVWSDAGQVKDPSALTGHGYRIEFSVAGGSTTYNVLDTTTNSVVQSAQPFTAGQAIQFEGVSLVAQGVPASGDALVVSPSTRSSLFGVMDQAISGIRDAANGAAVGQNVAQTLAQLDAGQSRLSSSRGMAGDLLNRVDDISSRQGTLSVQLEADRSRAEDLDVIKGMSEFQSQQTAYSAALGSYAQIQKLSLFNFIN